MPKTPGPNDIVLARRKRGHGNVTSDAGDWPEGGTIPMRRAEAEARDDCEPDLKDATLQSRRSPADRTVKTGVSLQPGETGELTNDGSGTALPPGEEE